MSCHEDIECDYKFLAAGVSYHDGRRKEALYNTCGSMATRFYARRNYTQNDQTNTVYIARCTSHTMMQDDNDNIVIINEDEYVTAKVMNE